MTSFPLRHLDKEATKIFLSIIALMNDQENFSLNNNPEELPLTVTKLSEGTLYSYNFISYSFAHLNSCAGQLIPNPEMIFLHIILNGADFIVPSFINSPNYSQNSVICIEGEWIKFNDKLKDQVFFANVWLRNIKSQQQI